MIYVSCPQVTFLVSYAELKRGGGMEGYCRASESAELCVTSWGPRLVRLGFYS